MHPHTATQSHTPTHTHTIINQLIKPGSQQASKPAFTYCPLKALSKDDAIIPKKSRDRPRHKAILVWLRYGYMCVPIEPSVCVCVQLGLLAD